MLCPKWRFALQSVLLIRLIRPKRLIRPERLVHAVRLMNTASPFRQEQPVPRRLHSVVRAGWNTHRRS